MKKLDKVIIDLPIYDKPVTPGMFPSEPPIKKELRP